MLNRFNHVYTTTKNSVLRFDFRSRNKNRVPADLRATFSDLCEGGGRALQSTRVRQAFERQKYVAETKTKHNDANDQKFL